MSKRRASATLSLKSDATRKRRKTSKNSPCYVELAPYADCDIPFAIDLDPVHPVLHHPPSSALFTEELDSKLLQHGKSPFSWIVIPSIRKCIEAQRVKLAAQAAARDAVKQRALAKKERKKKKSETPVIKQEAIDTPPLVVPVFVEAKAPEEEEEGKELVLAVPDDEKEEEEEYEEPISNKERYGDYSVPYRTRFRQESSLPAVDPQVSSFVLRIADKEQDALNLQKDSEIMAKKRYRKRDDIKIVVAKEIARINGKRFHGTLHVNKIQMWFQVNHKFDDPVHLAHIANQPAIGEEVALTKTNRIAFRNIKQIDVTGAVERDDFGDGIHEVKQSASAPFTTHPKFANYVDCSAILNGPSGTLMVWAASIHQIVAVQVAQTIVQNIAAACEAINRKLPDLKIVRQYVFNTTSTFHPGSHFAGMCVDLKALHDYVDGMETDAVVVEYEHDDPSFNHGCLTYKVKRTPDLAKSAKEREEKAVKEKKRKEKKAKNGKRDVDDDGLKLDPEMDPYERVQAKAKFAQDKAAKEAAKIANESRLAASYISFVISKSGTMKIGGGGSIDDLKEACVRVISDLVLFTKFV
jgi:hypothetical protein